MINEELIRNTPTKVTNGYRVVIINELDEMTMLDYRTLTSAYFHGGFDFSKNNGTICRIYRIEDCAVTYLKHSYVQVYGTVY